MGAMQAFAMFVAVAAVSMTMIAMFMVQSGQIADLTARLEAAATPNQLDALEAELRGYVAERVADAATVNNYITNTQDMLFDQTVNTDDSPQFADLTVRGARVATANEIPPAGQFPSTAQFFVPFTGVTDSTFNMFGEYAVLEYNQTDLVYEPPGGHPYEARNHHVGVEINAITHPAYVNVTGWSVDPETMVTQIDWEVFEVDTTQRQNYKTFKHWWILIDIEFTPIEEGASLEANYDVLTIGYMDFASRAFNLTGLSMDIRPTSGGDSDLVIHIQNVNGNPDPNNPNKFELESVEYMGYINHDSFPYAIVDFIREGDDYRGFTVPYAGTELSQNNEIILLKCLDYKDYWAEEGIYRFDGTTGGGMIIDFHGVNDDGTPITPHVLEPSEGLSGVDHAMMIIYYEA